MLTFWIAKNSVFNFHYSFCTWTVSSVSSVHSLLLKLYDMFEHSREEIFLLWEIFHSQKDDNLLVKYLLFSQSEEQGHL